jgi:hypothetical protein
MSTARDANGNLDAFVVGTNNAVYHQSQSPGGDWSGWKGLNRGPVKSLTKLGTTTASGIQRRQRSQVNHLLRTLTG